MPPRLAPALAASLVIAAVAACSSAVPARPSATTAEPAPTPIAWPSYEPEPAATASPDSGNVPEPRYPELTVESTGKDAIRATITDPAAKAWRLVVSGTGDGERGRLELVVETGDTGPSIQATEIRDGHVVGEMDLSGYADGTAAAGGCHRTLAVCVDSDGFRLPVDGDGTFSIHLVLIDPATTLTVSGGTATWPAEPFILGPWTDTAPFLWGDR